jgi:formylglycine-generating enzyme required for sulfatase activity
VDSHACNAYGVCDTAGNVWEWVQAPGASEMPPTRMLRGRSWRTVPRYVRPATRLELASGVRTDGVGFRVCRGVSAE